MQTRLARLRETLAQHEDFLQLLLLFVLARALLPLLMLPGSQVLPFALAAPDVGTIHRFGQLVAANQWPYLDFWIEYPPLMAFYSAGVYRLASLIPPWGENLHWLYLLTRAATLIFDTGSLLLLYLSARRLYDERRALRVAWFYALLFVPLYTFAIWNESIVLFFVLLALYGSIQDRPITSGLGMGLGFAAKLFPLALMPVALMQFRERPRLIRLLAATLIPILLVFAPLFALNPLMTWAFFENLRSRVPWQSLWALLVGYRGYGIVAPVDLRSDPAQVGWIPPEVMLNDPGGWFWLLVLALFAGLGLFFYTRRIDWSDARARLGFFVLTFGMMMLYIPGLSPQFFLYPVALLILLLPDWRGLIYGLLWGFTQVMVWPASFDYLQAGSSEWFPAWIVVQAILFLAMSIEGAEVALPLPQWFLGAKRAVLPVSTGAVLICLVGWGWNFASDYREARLAQEPLSSFVAAVESGEIAPLPIVATTPRLRERLEPYLPGLEYHVFPSVDGVWLAGYHPGDWIEAETRNMESFILVHDTADPISQRIDSTLVRWRMGNPCVLWERWAGTVQLRAISRINVMGTQFDDALWQPGLRLVDGGFPTQSNAGDGFCSWLSWVPEERADLDYAVSVQLLNSSGQLVAQSDSAFATPTSAMDDGLPYHSIHGVLLPGDLPPGDYRWIVVLYRADTFERATLTGGGDVYEAGILSVR